MVKRRETNFETLFQEALREQIGERRYSMWFGEGVRFVFSETHLSVRVETSEFLCNWICSAFKHTVEQLCRDFCGRVLPVEFLYVGDGTSESGVDGSASNADAATNAGGDARFVFPETAELRSTPIPREYPTSQNLPNPLNYSKNERELDAFGSTNNASNAVEAPKKRRGRPPKNQPRLADEMEVRSNVRSAGLFETAPLSSAYPADIESYPTFSENQFGVARSTTSTSNVGVNGPANANVGTDVPQEPRRRRGRPRKNPNPVPAVNPVLPSFEPTFANAEPASTPNVVENSVPVRNAFDVSFAHAADDRRPDGSFPGGAWNLSESERVAWAAGDFNDVGGAPEPSSPTQKTPGKRGRKKTVDSSTFAPPVVPPPVPPTLFDASADEEDVSRDERGFNIVKLAPTPQTRGKTNVSSANWATLDSFIEGFSNQLAKKVVEVAIVQPATMSPIFIYGPTSVGKTHLLEGVCDRYRRVPNRKPPLLMTAEEFTSAFIQSLRGGGAFRERFRDISLFALDDLHFLEGKITTQTELLNVVDFLRARRVQMIFAANRPLSELTKLRGELTTRIESGVACKIENPERETLSAIFRQMALTRRLVVSDDVCRYVVSRFATHARQLSGALNRLYAAHLTTGAPINLDLAKDALADMAAANVRNIKLEDVERVVRETFGLDADSLKSKSRSKRCADPRALAMWLARKYTRSGLAEIGRYFGGRQHSAVISAQKKVEYWLKTNEFLDAGGATVAVAETVERMERSLARPRI